MSVSVIRWVGAIAVVLTIGAAHAEPQMQVQVREAPVREKPAALSPVVGKLSYGDRVTVDEKRDDGWWRITGPNSTLRGWLRATALARKVNDLQAGDGAENVSGEDIALAGKGIGEIEGYVKTHDLQAAIAKLDDIERRSYTELSLDDLRAFQSAGGLTPAEGE